MRLGRLRPKVELMSHTCAQSEKGGSSWIDIEKEYWVLILFDMEKKLSNLLQFPSWMRSTRRFMTVFLVSRFIDKLNCLPG
jgi:hypothetical protein